jgi:hypothetical protein
VRTVRLMTKTVKTVEMAKTATKKSQQTATHRRQKTMTTRTMLTIQKIDEDTDNTDEGEADVHIKAYERVDRGDDLVAWEGTLVNDGDATSDYQEVFVTICNDEGHRIDDVYQRGIEPLEPDETRAFRTVEREWHDGYDYDIDVMRSAVTDASIVRPLLATLTNWP